MRMNIRMLLLREKRRLTMPMLQRKSIHSSLELYKCRLGRTKKRIPNLRKCLQRKTQTCRTRSKIS